MLLYHRVVNRCEDEDEADAGPWRQGEVYLSEDGWVCAGSQRFRVEGSQLSVFPSAPGSPHRYCLKLTSSQAGVQFCCKTESELRQWVLRLMPLIWTLPFSPAGVLMGRGEPATPAGHFKMSLIHTIEAVCSCALLNALLAMLLYSSPYNLDSWFFVAAVNAFVVFVVLVRVEQLVHLAPLPSSGNHGSSNALAAVGEEDLMVEDLDDTMISAAPATTAAVQVTQWNKSLPKFALQTTLRQSEDGIASPHSFTSFAENLIACCGCDLYLAQHPPSCEQLVFRDEEFEFTKSLIIVHVQLQHTSDRLLFPKAEPQPGYSLMCYYLPSSSNRSSTSFGEDGQGDAESESTRAVAGLFAAREELQLVMTCQMVANDDNDDDDDERGEERKKDDDDEDDGDDDTKSAFKPQPEVSINVPNTCINKYAVKTLSGKPLEVLEFNVNLRNLDLLSKLAINALLVNSGLLLTHHLRLSFTISTQHQKDKPTASIRLNLLDLTKVTLW